MRGIMNILNIEEINEDTVIYINNKLMNNYSLRSIIREQIGDNTTKNEVEKLRNMITKKIINLGYKYNSENRMYIKNQDDLLNLEENKLNLINKNKRKYVKKIDKKLLENPLHFEIQLENILLKIDSLSLEECNNDVSIGAYLNPKVVALFSPILERFNYISNYQLIKLAIYSVVECSKAISESNWLADYSNFIADTKKEKKKLVIIKGSPVTNKKIADLQSTFPILNKSDVISFSMFVFAQCYLKKYLIKDKESQQ